MSMYCVSAMIQKMLMKSLHKIPEIRNIYVKRNLHITFKRMGGFLDCSPNAFLDKGIADRFLCLPIPEPKAQVSYVWIDGTGLDVRMRSRTVDFVPSTYKECPNWTYDGSSTFFSTPEKSDNYMVPIAMYSDPFRRGNNKIVLCETFTEEKKPTKTNRRQTCIEVLNKVCDQELMFGFEQEFYLLGPDGRPYGWPCGAHPIQRGKNYAGVGPKRIIGRDIAESIYRCCLYAGVDVHSVTAERALGQWEVVTGPTLSIKAADDLWVTRYLIQRVTEAFAISATFRSTPVEHGMPSGLHTNMSTKKTRDDNGLKLIQDYISKLEENHKSDLKYFDCKGGDHIKKRLTGKNYTCDMKKFKSGVGDRTACVRISPVVFDKKKGFFQDRRPSSCADPYNIVTALVNTCLL